MKMFFKNTLKLSIALLIATPSLAASFQGVCNELNEELMANVKKNLREDDKIEYFEPLKECSVNKNGEIDEMYLVSERIDIDGIEKALSHKSIRNLTYFLDNGFYQEEPAVFNDFPTAINKLPNLEELTLKYYRNVFNHGDYIDVERKINASVFNLVSKKIKTVTLDHIKIDESVIEQLGKLKSLEKLIVYSGYISQHYTSNESNYKLLVKLNNIDTIILDEKVVNANHKYSGECQKMEDYLWPNALENIQSKDNKSLIIPLRECILNSKGEVSELYFVSQRNNKEVIEKALSLSQKSIEKLTYFIDSYDVSNKKATYEEFPIIINQMSNLKELTLKYKHEVIYNEELSYLNEKEVNPNILKISSKKLKTLTLDHVIITDEIIKRINEISSLEELYVFTGENYENDISVDNEVRERLETLNKNKKLKIMVDFRELYIINDELPISTNNRCGKDDGICPSGKCCSKYGYCGKTEEYCGKGCQSEFGECKTTTTTTTTTTKKSLPTSTNDRCGKDYGVCPSGKCCSKYGYCGKSDDHCGKGCQSEFGKCKSSTTTTKKSLPTSTNDRCGKDYGVCPSGKCCSKYGYCGKSEAHCGKGCQSEFGKCN